MSSSSLFLAYIMRQPESAEVIDIRLRHAEMHLERINRSPIERTQVGDGSSGFVGWGRSGTQIDWRPFIRKNSTGVAWLHVPSIAGGPETGLDEWQTAHSVIDGAITPGQIGSPFAVARWQDGQLEIKNDMLGLVRLFHFSFEDADIWTTRPGLAHVFMGVKPTKNLLAWSGMATLGWATSGTTQLGEGKQLPGGTYIRGGREQGRQKYIAESNFPEWLQFQRQSAEPSAEANVRDMELYMSTAKRWAKPARADLSGGKDSRVVSAIGIRTGAISHVRTVATDHGEVETARHLMSLINTDIVHEVVPRKDPSGPGGSFVERVGSHHRAWEGRYLSTTAYNSKAFSGFGASRAPIFNGLGGEVMAGGNLLGTWHSRLINAPSSAAGKKLAAMANSGRGASQDTKDRVTADIQAYIRRSEVLGLDGAADVMDLFYHLDKMPNWSITYCTPNTLTPLFAPSLLAYAAHRTGRPVDYGDAHRRLLKVAIPQWSDVPFYKPTAKKRAMPFIWENNDWQEIEEFIHDKVESTVTFDRDEVLEILDLIRQGQAQKREEIFVQRFIWEMTFDRYLSELATQCEASSRAVAAHIRSLSG